MKKSERRYRIGYDAYFESFRPIEYNGSIYDGGISLLFMYKFFDENNKEVLFRETDNPKTGISVHIDANDIYRFQNNPKYAYNGYRVEAVPDSATIWIDAQTPVDIPFEDGVALLKKYFDDYNISDNNPAQNLAYKAEEVIG